MLKKRIEHCLDCRGGGKNKRVFGVLLIRKPFSTYDTAE
jgi:hypothetical protein